MGDALLWTIAGLAFAAVALLILFVALIVWLAHHWRG